MLRLFIAIIAFCVFAWLTLNFTGYVIVDDKTSLAETARVTNGKWHQVLSKLPFGYFVVIPDLEGEVEVLCSDGSRVSGGYVTKRWQQRLAVTGEGSCNRLIQL